MTQFAISQSKVSDWLRCRRAYHLRWVEHLKPRRVARPLKFGAVMHELHDAEISGQDKYKKLKQIAARDAKMLGDAEYGDLIADVTYIQRAYDEYYSKQPKLQFKKIDDRTAEHPFNVELTADIVCKGKIDAIITQPPKGSLPRQEWVLEHKNHKEFPNADHRWRNLQSAVYLRIVEMLGWAKPSGMLWNYIRSKPPTRPQLLVSGKLSLRSDIDTLPQVIIDTQQFYANQGYKLAKLQKLDSYVEESRRKLHTWFDRVYTPVKPHIVRRIFAEFVETGREILDYYERTDKPPRHTIGLHCSWCAFEPLCRAELQSKDDKTEAYDWVKKYQFVVDDSEYQQEVVE